MSLEMTWLPSSLDFLGYYFNSEMVNSQIIMVSA